MLANVARKPVEPQDTKLAEFRFHPGQRELVDGIDKNQAQTLIRTICRQGTDDRLLDRDSIDLPSRTVDSRAQENDVLFAYRLP